MNPLKKYKIVAFIHFYCILDISISMVIMESMILLAVLTPCTQIHIHRRHFGGTSHPSYTVNCLLIAGHSLGFLCNPGDEADNVLPKRRQGYDCMALLSRRSYSSLALFVRLTAAHLSNIMHARAHTHGSVSIWRPFFTVRVTRFGLFFLLAVAHMRRNCHPSSPPPTSSPTCIVRVQ